MTNCYECKHRRRIPGDCHSQCHFNFAEARMAPPKGNPHGIKEGWWVHPWSFDPVWMVGDCGGFTTKAGPAA